MDEVVECVLWADKETREGVKIEEGAKETDWGDQASLSDEFYLTCKAAIPLLLQSVEGT